MKNFILVSMLCLSGCITSQTKDEPSVWINVPKVDKQVEINNLKQAKENKIKIGEKYENVFEFYPGPRGSYYIIVSGKDPKKPVTIDLKLYDAILMVDEKGKTPETIILAMEYDRFYSGFGSVREGPTQYSLKLIPVDNTMAKKISFTFKVKMKGY